MAVIKGYIKASSGREVLSAYDIGRLKAQYNRGLGDEGIDALLIFLESDASILWEKCLSVVVSLGGHSSNSSEMFSASIDKYAGVGSYRLSLDNSLIHIGGIHFSFYFCNEFGYTEKEDRRNGKKAVTQIKKVLSTLAKGNYGDVVVTEPRGDDVKFWDSDGEVSITFGVFVPRAD